MQSYNTFEPDIYFLREKEKDEIKRIGTVAGVCILCYVAIQNLLSFLMLIEPFKTLYSQSGVFTYSFTIVVSILSLVFPALIAGKGLEKKTGADVFKFDRPLNTEYAVYLIVFGMFVCICGNYITSWFETFAQFAGFQLEGGDFNVPSGLYGRIAYIVAIAVVPPFAEEIAMRGVVMQPLRKYGDGFAIVVTAFVFAVLHGNLIQAPFAFVCALGIGYAVCITESLWVGMAIHFINNLYSVIISFAINDLSEEASDRVYLILTAVVFLISIFGGIMFFSSKDRPKLQRKATFLKGNQKFGAFVLNAAMIVSLIIMLVITSFYVKYTG
ncbi:MAG: CPBP family intramembrane metalloprotease [Clostridiales bacterium]|nr:CPBP family intramembrane metalloprotease [Clostridiales bacterium]